MARISNKKAKLMIANQFEQKMNSMRGSRKYSYTWKSGKLLYSYNGGSQREMVNMGAISI